MRKFFILALAVLAFGCRLATSPGAVAPRAVSVSVAGAKGIFLAAGSASMKSIRTLSGRDLVTSSGATLGAVSSAGVPSTVSWTASTGATVTATVSRAVQLDSGYVLLTYSIDGVANITAALNLSSGALASISVVPDNWTRIFARGAQAWYESGGGIYAADMDSGSATEISTSSATWDSNTGTKTGTSAWNPGSWIYSDNSENVYSLYATNSQYVQAVAISNGSTIDFGSSRVAWQFMNYIPGLAGTYGQAWPIYDPASGNLYLLQNDSVGGAGTGLPAQTLLDLYSVTLDPSVPGVVTIGTTALASSVVTAAVYGSTNIASGTDLTRTIFSNGPQTWTVSVSGGVPSLTSYDTSAVPLANNRIVGQVLNWQYSEGAIYSLPSPAGTTPVISSISLAQFGTAPNVTDPVLIPSGAISASVVGSVLFYTTGGGTFSAPIDTVSGILGASTPYAGGTVKAITQ